MARKRSRRRRGQAKALQEAAQAARGAHPTAGRATLIPGPGTDIVPYHGKGGPLARSLPPIDVPAGKPGGSLLGTVGKVAGGGLTAFMLYQMITGGMERGKRAKAARMLPVDSPDQILAQMAREEMMAGREARLMRADPEAYQLLQGAMGQDNGPALATGEFAVGASGGQQVGPAQMEEVLKALRGE